MGVSNRGNSDRTANSGRHCRTATAKLFTFGNDAVVASVAATEATNRKGTYIAAFTDVPAGEYELILIDDVTGVNLSHCCFVS